jgi:hypothetical protein
MVCIERGGSDETMDLVTEQSYAPPFASTLYILCANYLVCNDDWFL